MTYELMFRSGRTRPAHARSSGSEMLLHTRSLVGSIIDTRESSFRKRQVAGFSPRQNWRAAAAIMNNHGGCAHRRDCVASTFAAGPARTARALLGGASETTVLFHGAMVSTMILIPANALSISRCTLSTSDVRNSCSFWSSDVNPSSSPIEFEVNRATEDLIRSALFLSLIHISEPT